MESKSERGHQELGKLVFLHLYYPRGHRNVILSWLTYQIGQADQPLLAVGLDRRRFRIRRVRY